MNPGKLNHRIKFSRLVSTQNESMGAVAAFEAVTVSDTDTPDTTWGDLRPPRYNDQLALEAGASVLNDDKVLKIRYRTNFTPTKDMMFEDVQAGQKYTVHAIIPYDEKTKNGVFEDKKFIYILGKKRE